MRDTEAQGGPGRWWPAHPRDVEPGDDTRVPSTSLYFGAAGMAWALRYLHDVGATPRRFALDLDRLRDVHHDEARMLDAARTIIAEMETLFAGRRRTPTTRPPSSRSTPTPPLPPARPSSSTSRG